MWISSKSAPCARITVRCFTNSNSARKGMMISVREPAVERRSEKPNRSRALMRAWMWRIFSWSDTVPFVVYVPRGREHVADEILRKV